MKSNLIYFACLLLVGCASGGGSPVASVSTPVTAPAAVATPVNSDERIKFEPMVQKETIPVYGDVTKTYSVGNYQPSTNFPSTDKYKIADYAFFTASVKGTHSGFNGDPNEPIRAGTWEPTYQIMEADINGDGHKDFFAVEYIQGARDSSPRSNLLPFINDGKGHFKLSPETFANKQFACIGYGDQINSTDVNNECGFYKSIVRHPVVDDLDGDGKADFFWPSLLYLSKGGALQNASAALPNFFKQAHYGPIFAHDLASGDVDGNKTIDIFVPVFGTTKAGFKLDGTKDPCSTCNQPLPWVMLINDGKGNFTSNTNIPTMPILASDQSIHLWASTAAIADFDGDGKGDIAVGWGNPAYAEKFNYVKNSAGMVYYNNGKNDWRVRTPTQLPANWYGANGRANDMVAVDVDGDGRVDIALASTRSDPYYVGRMVQIFKNVDGTSFVDVTKTANPNTKYELGNGTTWWNGEGMLKVVDFNKDGKPDIVDSSYNTYVLINEGGKFKLVDNFPLVGGGSDGKNHGALYPVEIDGKWDYDFISYRFDSNGDVGTTTMYQVLDPPANLYDSMLSDFLNKPSAYSDMAVLANRGYSDAFYYSRSNSSAARVFSTYNNGIQSYGGTFKIGDIGITLLNAKANKSTPTSLFGAETDAVAFYTAQGNVVATVGYGQTRLNGSVDSNYFGTAIAATTANTFGAELVYKNNVGNLTYGLGSRYNETYVKGFREQGNDLQLMVAEHNIKTANLVATLEYLDSFRIGRTHFYYGADVEHLNYFYTSIPNVRVSTGSEFTGVPGRNVFARNQTTVSLNAGAWLYNKVNVGFSVSNLTKDPSYTVSAGMRF